MSSSGIPENSVQIPQVKLSRPTYFNWKFPLRSNLLDQNLILWSLTWNSGKWGVLLLGSNNEGASRIWKRQIDQHVIFSYMGRQHHFIGNIILTYLFSGRALNLRTVDVTFSGSLLVFVLKTTPSSRQSDPIESEICFHNKWQQEQRRSWSVIKPTLSFVPYLLFQDQAL